MMLEPWDYKVDIDFDTLEIQNKNKALMFTLSSDIDDYGFVRAYQLMFLPN